MPDEIIIHNQEQHRASLAERRKKSDARQIRSEAVTHFDHMKVAHQIIQEISVMNIDPFVKKVLIMRIAGPVVRGQERTHKSIAIELGASVEDVISAEEFGKIVVPSIMGKFDIHDLIGRYDRNKESQRIVKDAIGG